MGNMVWRTPLLQRVVLSACLTDLGTMFLQSTAVFVGKERFLLDEAGLGRLFCAGMVTSIFAKALLVRPATSWALGNEPVVIRAGYTGAGALMVVYGLVAESF